ncbi:uncharacterized protein BP5553_03629 [Venustampulla echinocandica]|uniref:P-loop containing nucleoside triphosphate hydrolase n=1 Tax=Venustampulla echinocandica TaxID=2656787 RepID=A0A370TUV2_9HELO|nr:uncharacterized protein BP5553_03629 [Venustampulla echinocandica]RDL39289.1 hypothetical protein BP5553_03629 [Venustampulla echinocandica]
MESDPASAKRNSSSPLSTRTTFDTTPQTPEESEAARLYDYHLSLLRPSSTQQGLQEVTIAPIFTMPVLMHAEAAVNKRSSPAFPQYGLLAGKVDAVRQDSGGNGPGHPSSQDPRIFFNIAAPSSTFICGFQGSGKSHTLSCLLENCLIPSNANRLPHPSRALFSITTQYVSCVSNIKVEPLRISEGDLNTKRMLDLMAVSRDDGPMPLYLHAVYRILREMRIEQQEMGTAFNYASFKERLAQTAMTPAQLGPLHQRLETLESFMPTRR